MIATILYMLSLVALPEAIIVAYLIGEYRGEQKVRIEQAKKQLQEVQERMNAYHKAA